MFGVFFWDVRAKGFEGGTKDGVNGESVRGNVGSVARRMARGGFRFGDGGSWDLRSWDLWRSH